MSINYKPPTVGYSLRQAEMLRNPHAELSFWADVEPYTKDECWFWKGLWAEGEDNGGVFVWGGVRILARRAMYFVTRRWIPGAWAHWDVYAICGDKECINPNHLTAGTKEERRYAARRYRVLLGKKVNPQENEFELNAYRTDGRPRPNAQRTGPRTQALSMPGVPVLAEA